MATRDDTSMTHRSRRKQSKSASESPSTAPPGGGDSATPPRTLEEAVEDVRVLLLQIRATLHCLSDVLLYTDDDDAVMHAEVAKALEGWVNEAAVKLELVNLMPLIEAVRRRGNGEEGEGGPASREVYQVKESTPVYLV